MILTRNDVQFVREAFEDSPVEGALELRVLCVYQGLTPPVGTLVHLNVLTGARRSFTLDQLWADHGAFLEDRALEALNQEITAHFPPTLLQ